MHGLVHLIQDVLCSEEAHQVAWATIATSGHCRFWRFFLLTSGFLGRHDDFLPFQVQESSLAPLNFYLFLDLQHLSCDAVLNNSLKYVVLPVMTVVD